MHKCTTLRHVSPLPFPLDMLMSTILYNRKRQPVLQPDVERKSDMSPRPYFDFTTVSINPTINWFVIQLSTLYFSVDIDIQVAQTSSVIHLDVVSWGRRAPNPGVRGNPPWRVHHTFDIIHLSASSLRPQLVNLINPRHANPFPISPPAYQSDKPSPQY